MVKSEERKKSNFSVQV